LGRLKGRACAAGSVVGLLVLRRPGLVVIGAAVILVSRRAGLLLVVVAAAAVAGLWFVISWFTLGSALLGTMMLRVRDHRARGPGRTGCFSTSASTPRLSGSAPSRRAVGALPAVSWQVVSGLSKYGAAAVPAW
jgi:hypothetical protein